MKRTKAVTPPSSLISVARHALNQQALVKALNRGPGSVAELGVLWGGSAWRLNKAMHDCGRVRPFYLYDTFSGLPTPSPVDLEGAGKHALSEGRWGDQVSLAAVQRHFEPWDNLVWREGLFPDSAREDGDQRFCFVHVDADLHDSIKAALEFFVPRMVEGGVIVLDDYGAACCPGAQKAVDDFLETELGSRCVFSRDLHHGCRLDL